MSEETRNNTTIQQEVDHLLLANYVPACVIINAEDMEILHVRGHTGPYLKLAPGKTSFNLLKMAREGLRLGLRTAIHSAKQGNHMVTKEGLLVTAAGTTREVRVTVIPLKDPPIGRYFLVLFEEMLTPFASSLSSSDGQIDHASKRSVAARRIVSLE